MNANLADTETLAVLPSHRLKLTKREVVVAACLLFFIAMAVVGPMLAHDPISQDAARRLMPPSSQHPFGSDELRRDLFARSLYGLRASLLTSVVAVTPAALLGIVLGFTAGYSHRWLDTAIMRVVDAWMAFPGLLSALAVITIVGPGSIGVGLAILTILGPSYARLSRSLMLQERNKDYVLGAVVVGATPLRIIFRHIAPNAMPSLITQYALSLSFAILISASLSFLGLGERPPEPSLGGLLNQSRPYLRSAWWYVMFPTTVFAALMILLNLTADILNDRLAR